MNGGLGTGAENMYYDADNRARGNSFLCFTRVQCFGRT